MPGRVLTCTLFGDEMQALRNGQPVLACILKRRLGQSSGAGVAQDREIIWFPKSVLRCFETASAGESFYSFVQMLRPVISIIFQLTSWIVVGHTWAAMGTLQWANLVDRNKTTRMAGQLRSKA